MTDYLFRPPRCTPESRAGRPPRPRTERRGGMLIERDVAVEVAPGEPVYVDVYRPDSPEPVAPLIAWSPYGKHNPAPIGIIYPRSGVRPEDTSELTTFEDVFVALFKLDSAGNHVRFPYYAQFDDGPAAVGWQRASHREPDTERSTPYLPVLAHRRALPVPRGEVVRLDIEVLPSGTRFEPGERLLLVVQGSDVNRYPKPAVYARHEATVNNGPHVLHTGGRYPSRLVVPVLPAGDERG